MAVEQPAAGDPLNSPSHSLMHRIVATDAAAPVQSLTVNASGDVTSTTKHFTPKLYGGTANTNSLDLYAYSASQVQTNTGRIKCHERITFPDDQVFTASYGVDSLITASHTITAPGVNNMFFPFVFDSRTVRYNTSQVASIVPTFWASTYIEATFDPTDVLTYWQGFLSTPRYQGGSGSTSPSTTNLMGYVASPTLLKSSAATSVSVTNLTGFATWNVPIFGTNDIPTGTSATNIYHYKCSEPVQNGGSSTNQFGLYIPAFTISTNNYGIYSDLASSTGRYFIYDAGGAASYFKGTVNFGSSINAVSYEDSSIFYEDDKVFYHSTL